MPNPKFRKNGELAKKRMSEKYILVDENSHPHRLYPPIKKSTAELKQVLDTKNFLRIMTQIGLNKYVVLQYYIYCEEDIWVCGDAMILNQNPDKKILGQTLCTKTRRVCCAYDEHSYEFLILCPKCYHIGTAVTRTLWKCKHCNFSIHPKLIEKAPFVKCDCEFCPVEIGWEKVDSICETNREFYKSLLQMRTAQAQEILMKKLRTGEDVPDNFDIKDEAMDDFKRKADQNG